MLLVVRKELSVGISQDDIDTAAKAGEHSAFLGNGAFVRLFASELVSEVVSVNKVLGDRYLKEKIKAIREIGMFAVIEEFPGVDLHADLERIRSLGDTEERELILPDSAIFTPGNEFRADKTYQEIKINVARPL